MLDEEISIGPAHPISRGNLLLGTAYLTENNDAS